jgi:hypothetical protein
MRCMYPPHMSHMRCMYPPPHMTCMYPQRPTYSVPLGLSWQPCPLLHTLLNTHVYIQRTFGPLMAAMHTTTHITKHTRIYTAYLWASHGSHAHYCTHYYTHTRTCASIHKNQRTPILKSQCSRAFALFFL